MQTMRQMQRADVGAMQCVGCSVIDTTYYRSSGSICCLGHDTEGWTKAENGAYGVI